jgi:uncharacterized protein YneF (UPF0154 family)
MEFIDILIVVIVPFIIGVVVGMYFEKKLKKELIKTLRRNEWDIYIGSCNGYNNFIR